MRGLLAQVLALARRLVRERGHRGEALDELDLGVGERPVGADAVDVQRPDDAVVGEQRHAHERLVVVRRAGDDVADVVEAHVRHVPRAAVAHHPAGRARDRPDSVSAMISSTQSPSANTGRRPVPSASTS